MLIGFAKEVHELLDNNLDTPDPVGLEIVITDGPTDKPRFPIKATRAKMPESYVKAVQASLDALAPPGKTWSVTDFYRYGLRLEVDHGLDLMISLAEVNSIIEILSCAMADCLFVPAEQTKTPVANAETKPE